MITTNTFAGRITGTRLHIEGMASAYVWQLKRPFAVVLAMTFAGHSSTTDNSTGVSARKRRRL